ncbi:MAG: hypothetical protein JOY90_03935 [Bradyrhizobium sp.]|uniref:hypothetical protein n=1 Tax=Bradyrhizobium sp. TaxID=376 RepID=UPI001DCAA3A6|nr:hypothetical protein [Bradyrhizobium sp.]MBV9559599.1 hypothetical protein [Bradyrhizobium sp.]
MTVMAVNMAQKRARKAQRRKELATLARREDALQNSLPARVARAAQAPIRGCYVNEALFEIGMGTLVVARGATIHYVVMAAFLLDTFALGIKDVTFEQVEGEIFDHYMDRMDETSPIVTVDPAYARRLLRELAAWSKGLGFAPHRNFAAVERIFGDISADASDAVFQFGHQGEPLLIGGPSDSMVDVSRRSEQIEKYLADRAGDVA